MTVGKMVKNHLQLKFVLNGCENLKINESFALFHHIISS